MATQKQSSCLLLDLPLELLHVIFDVMEKKTILSARETCSTLADIGSEYLLDEVITVYKRDRLQRLLSIAQHSKVSKSVRSIYWQSDRLKEPALSFEKWNKIRTVARPWAEYNIYHEIPLLHDETLDPTTERSQRAFKRAHQRYDRNMKGTHTDSELQAAYESYQALIKDQVAIARSKFDLKCFTTFFKACPKLESVTVATAYGSAGFKDAGRMAFKEAMVAPYGDSNVLDSGVHQFWTIIRALYDAQHPPKRFTATDVSYRIVRETWSKVDCNLMMAHLMSDLHEFRLGLSIHEDELDPMIPGQNIDIGIDCYIRYVPGILAKWLSDAPQLRVLKLRMYHNHFANIRPEAKLKDVVGSTTWPKLRELGINDVLTTQNELLDLLLRHKDSLRRLSLSYIYLEQGTWVDFIQEIGGKLPKLKKVKLRGDMTDLEAGTYEFAVPGCGEESEHPIQEAAEKFILYGGESLEEYLVPDAEAEASDPDMPFNFEINRIEDEDAGYTTDGSAISYGSDGFDSTV